MTAKFIDEHDKPYRKWVIDSIANDKNPATTTLYWYVLIQAV